MKTIDKKALLKWNTLLWITAMVLPAMFSIAMAANRFPWQIIVPLLLIAPMLVSNRMLAQALTAPSTEGPPTK
jgi:hypothetical protein